MDFSSVFVIINLQTWVLLLDYLGIGIPTPPPSRPDSPDGGVERVNLSTRSEQRPSKGQGVPRDHISATNDATGSSDQLRGTPLVSSLLSDARDMLSLGTDLDRSLYVSTCQEPQPGERDTVIEGSLETFPGGNLFSDLAGMQESYGMDSLSIDHFSRDQGSSVWGVEGKVSLRVKLNVNSLTVTFNKPEHPLARGGVSGVTAEVKLVRGNVEISGSLGQGSVMDMTETGAYYRERLGADHQGALP